MEFIIVPTHHADLPQSLAHRERPSADCCAGRHAARPSCCRLRPSPRVAPRFAGETICDSKRSNEKTDHEDKVENDLIFSASGECAEKHLLVHTLTF